MERPPRCGVQGHDLECEECGVKLYDRDVKDVCRYEKGELMGWVKCWNCGGTGLVREMSGHGDYDNVLCSVCNPNERDRMAGIRSPNAGKVWVDEAEESVEESLADVNQYQTVTLTLSDGRKLNFSGRAAIDVGDEDKLKVVGIEFSKPRPLPQGMNFSVIGDEG